MLRVQLADDIEVHTQSADTFAGGYAVGGLPLHSEGLTEELLLALLRHVGAYVGSAHKKPASALSVGCDDAAHDGSKGLIVFQRVTVELLKPEDEVNGIVAVGLHESGLKGIA